MISENLTHKNLEEKIQRLESENLALKLNSFTKFSESEQLFQTLIKTSPDAIIITDTTGNVIFISDKTTENFGIKTEELLGTSIFQWIAKEDRKRATINFKSIIKGGQSKGNDYKIIRNDGVSFIGEIRSSSVNDASGKLYGMISILRDVTARKITEENIRNNEVKFRAIFEKSREAIGVSKNGKHIFANPAYLNLFGYDSNDELEGKSVLLLISNDCRPIVKRYTKNRIDGEVAPSFYETRGLRKDGSEFDLEVLVSIYTNNNESFTLAILRDITERLKVETNLRQNEDYLRQITDNVPVFVSHIDNNLRYKFVNRAYESTFGLHRNDIIGKKVQDIIGEIAYERSLPYMSQVLSGQTVSFENTILNNNNEIRLIDVTYIPRFDRGKISGYIILGNDITQRKQTEELLLDSLELNNKIVSSSSFGILSYNADTGICVMANEAAARIVGGTVDDLLKMDFRQIPSWKQSGLLETAEKVLLTNKEKRLRISMISSFQKHVWLDCSINLFENKGQRNLLLMFEDITAKKIVENALISSEQKYRQLFENMTAGFALHEIICDKSGKPVDYRFLEVNQAFEKYTGLYVDELIGKTVKEVLPKTEDYWIETYGRVAQTGEPIAFHNYSGELKKHFDVWAFCPEKGRFAVMFTDITERKQIEFQLIENQEKLEQTNKEYRYLTEELYGINKRITKINKELKAAKVKAEESDLLKSAFLSNMSHEIRTPMNAIKGFSQLLNRPGIPVEKKEKFIQIINQNADDLLRIVNDILDISILEVSQMIVMESEGSIINLFDELVDFYKSKNDIEDKRNVQFRTKINIDPEDNSIRTDFEKLKQILLNLLSNSFKFTEKGYIEIAVEKQNEQTLLFTVKDTGIGIPQELHDHIFERFRQGNNIDFSQNRGGIGLGLSISKGLVELLGGEIRVESELTKGTTFFFTIPFHSIKELIKKESKTNIQFEWPDKFVLLVEDNQYNADYLIEVLLNANVKFKHVSTAQDAISFIETGNLVDIVLMDIKLPDINGYDLTRKIKKLCPNLKVIAQTAYANEDDKEKCFEAGCCDYIAKPIEIEDLLQIINNHLS